MQTRSGTAACGPVELFYEDVGEPGDPPVLLIMGVGAQLPMWPDAPAKDGPTVVVHGSQDPMVRPRNGRNLARVIDGARYVVVDGMGHDLPEPVWRPVVEALTENFAIAARPV